MSFMTWEELEAEYQGMYERMETNDEGDITIRTVVEHIKGVEAGSGNNNWVKFYSYVYREYKVSPDPVILAVSESVF